MYVSIEVLHRVKETSNKALRNCQIKERERSTNHFVLVRSKCFHRTEYCIRKILYRQQPSVPPRAVPGLHFWLGNEASSWLDRDVRESMSIIITIVFPNVFGKLDKDIVLWIRCVAVELAAKKIRVAGKWSNEVVYFLRMTTPHLPNAET
jgi:hypothetical protein